MSIITISYKSSQGLCNYFQYSVITLRSYYHPESSLITHSLPVVLRLFPRSPWWVGWLILPTTEGSWVQLPCGFLLAWTKSVYLWPCLRSGSLNTWIEMSRCWENTVNLFCRITLLYGGDCPVYANESLIRPLWLTPYIVFLPAYYTLPCPPTSSCIPSYVKWFCFSESSIFCHFQIYWCNDFSH